MTVWTAAGAALLLCAALPARAAPPADTSVEEARAAYDKGSTEFDLGHYQNALIAFEKAFTLRHVPALLFNIAQCHRLLGKMKEAATVYRSFLAKDPNNARAEQARTLLAQVESALGKQTEAQTAQPTDTQQDPSPPKGAAAQPAPQALTPPSPPPPAEKPVEKPAPPTQRVVRVAEATPVEPAQGASDEQQLALAQRNGRAQALKSAPAAATSQQQWPPPEQPKQRVFTWVAAGGAAVAVGIGAGFGARASSTKSSLQQTSHTGAEVVALQTDEQSDARKANAAFAVAAALAVVAATFFVIEF
jgi:tetratricopeptide (TPR) repeat protein